jgi:hypothetical protein
VSAFAISLLASGAKLHMEVTFCKAFALARAKGAETPNALSLDADRSRTLLPRECRYIVTCNAPGCKCFAKSIGKWVCAGIKLGREGPKKSVGYLEPEA